MFLRAIRRGWTDAFHFMGGYQVWLAVIAIPVVGFGLHWAFGERTAIKEQVSYWLIYGLAATAFVFATILVWNVLCAPYRIERDLRIKLQGNTNLQGKMSTAHIELDWNFRQLIEHIDPLVFRDETEDGLEPLRQAEKEILDQASIGNLQVWGRKFDSSGMNNMMGITNPLIPIPKERWSEFYLEHHAIFDARAADDAQVAAIDGLSGPLFSDLRIRSSEAKSIWPKAIERLSKA